VKIFKQLLVLVVLLISYAEGRVPENLQGTTIFPTSIRIALPKKKPSKRPVSSTAGEEVKPAVFAAELEDEFCDLPTGALNWVNGAEFFMTVLQPLYWYANNVEVIKNDTEEAAAVAASASEDEDEDDPPLLVPADVAHIEPLVSREPKYITMFYKNNIIKEPLLYNQSNPLGVLVRALFWQLPGTTGLGDFRLKLAALVRDKETKKINMSATTNEWAKFIARVVALYRLQKEVPSPQLTKKIEGLFPNPSDRVVGALHFFDTNLEKPSFGRLIWDCIEYSKKNDLGYDFPLCILMGGIYELIGDDRKLIAQFYTNLYHELIKKIPELRSQLEASILPAIIIFGRVAASSPDTVTAVDELGAVVARPLSAQVVDERERWAIRLIKSLRGDFSLIDYRRNVEVFGEFFPDCLETTARNILLALVRNDDGSFQSDLVRADVAFFLEQFPTMVEQAKPEAHNAWAEIVSNLPGMLYSCETTDHRKYNLRGTASNFLAMLNYIFELGISDFTTHVMSIEEGSGVANKVFIENVVPKINEALKEKFEFGEDHDDIIYLPEYGISDAPDEVDSGQEINFSGDVTCCVQVKEINLIVETTGYHAAVSVDKMASVAWAASVPCCGYLKTALLNKLTPGDPVRYAISQIHVDLTDVKLGELLPGIKDNEKIASMLLVKILEIYAKDQVQGQALFKKCFFEGLFIEDALRVAEFDLYNGKLKGLHLFKALVEAGCAFDKVLKVAQDCIANEDFKFPIQALFLFNILIEKEFGFVESLAAADNCFANSDDRMHVIGLALLSALVVQGRAYGKALRAARKYIESDKSYIINGALELLIELVQKREGFDLATTAAQQGALSHDYVVQRGALLLFKALVKQGRALAEAQTAATSLISSDDYIVSENAYDLWGLLPSFHSGVASSGIKIEELD
jgi:hypothetical protein